MALRVLRCVNRLGHVSLDVFAALWRKDHIFWNFRGSAHKSRVDKMRCLQLQSNGIVDARSKCTFVLLGYSTLFDNMFVSLRVLNTFLCPRQALFSSVSLCMLSLPLCYLLCLSTGCFLCLLHVHTWSKDVWSNGMTSQAQQKWTRMQARRHKSKNGNVQQIRRPSLPKRFSLSLSLSLSLSAFSLESCIRVPSP